MYLDKIELQGFKSFAERTLIDFPAPPNKDSKGVTVIVGPNGSGKSNIIDAIRWVLGEQSTKTLRGKKGADIIFSGSKTKPRMGMAEVTLYFNNEKHKAPIDYDEIVITRRLYRDGDSEYILNNNKVRLHDIIMLLAKCNVGQKSYSIIGQGMITKIITSTPIERKAFFDEATGIKQYQIRRDKAVNKLNRTKDHLEQSSNILNELTPRLKLLKRQVSKLEQRKIIEKDLTELQSKYYSKIWQELEKKNISLTLEIQKQTKEKNNLEKEIKELQQKIGKLSQGESRQEIYNDLQKKHNDFLFEKNILNQELANIKAKTNIEYTKIGKQNLSWLELKEDEISQKIFTAQKDIEKYNRDIEKKEKQIQDKSSELYKSNEKFEQIENSLIQAQRDDNNNFIFSKNHINTILNQKESIPGIIGTISDLAYSEPKFARALEIAAGRYMEAIVVKDENTARECIQFLKNNRLGTATFLPLSKIQRRQIKNSTQNSANSSGSIGMAIDLLKFGQEYEAIFSFIFGSTIIIENMKAAKTIGVGNERMVTLDGDLFESSGVIKGGFRRYKSSFTFKQSPNSSSVNSHEIESLEKSRIELLNSKKELESQINQLKIEVEISKSQNKLLLNTHKSLKEELNRIKVEITHNNIDPKNKDQLLDNLLKEKEILKEKISELDKNILNLRKKIDDFNNEEEEKKNKIFNIQHQSQENQTELNTVNQELNSLNIQLTRVETKKEDLVNELINEIGTDYNTHIINEEITIDLEEANNKIQKFKNKLSIIGGIDPEVVDEYNEVSERHEFLKEQIDDLDKALKNTKKIIKELDEIIKNQFHTAFKKINKAFNNYFHKLFEGGKAKLDLIQQETKTKAEETILDENGQIIETEEEPKEDNTNLTATGIEINAAPPNKKIANLSMLSGGEKTMTAIALICAILSNNPSPFVFLDEVDAALDESNSFKLNTILTELSNLTQFIIITHNRVIMNAANLLYGVAMNTDGITKLLSLNITEASEMAENIN